MIEKQIFDNIKTLLEDMKVDVDSVYNLDWALLETMDELLSPTPLGPNQRRTLEQTPALFMAYGMKSDQYIGDTFRGDVGFDDITSLGNIREMTPIILRVVLLDDPDNGTEVISSQIAKAREDIRNVIGDKLRTGTDTEKIDEVYRVYVGPYEVSSESIYTNTAEFIIPVFVWWRQDYREPGRVITATITNPILEDLAVTRSLADTEVVFSFTIPDDASMKVRKNDSIVQSMGSDLTLDDTETSWTDSGWSIDDTYQFEVTDSDDVLSKTPVLTYPYYPTMLPESLYHEGDSPEQKIERKIRQMIQKEIDDEDSERFEDIITTAVGPLSPNYLKPDQLPVICVMFDQSTLAIGSKLGGYPISDKNVGWRTANARDQTLSLMTMIHAPADRNYTDPYKQLRIVDKTLSDLRSFVIRNEQWEGVSSVYQSIIGPTISPRAAENVQGDLLFVGRFNFIVRYRER